MEQRTNVDNLTEQIDESSSSPPQKKQSISQMIISSNSKQSHKQWCSYNWRRSNWRWTMWWSMDSESQKYKLTSTTGVFIYILPSKEDFALAPLVWRSERGTEIGALYKVSPSKFVLVFGAKTAKEKLTGIEIQCRFGGSELCLNFRKRVCPLRDGKKSILVTIFLPELISDQGVRLAFSNFGEVVSVFKGRHKFNRNIRNGKWHVKIFPTGGDPAILRRKIYFHGSIRRDVFFAEKVVLCYRWKTRHMLYENCSEATHTPEDSAMSFTEQSGKPSPYQNPVQPVSSAENHPCGEFSW